MFKNPRVLLLIVMVLLLGAIVTVMKKPPNLGLDLKGGTRLTLEAVATQDVPDITTQVMDSLRFVVERRVNGMGIGEAIVQKSGDKRIIVEIPGVKDPEQAKKILGKVGNLEFRKIVNGHWVSTGVSGKDLARADLGPDSDTGGWLIKFELNAQGAERFGQLTAELAPQHEMLGIFFDDKFISSPHVKTAIVDGQGVISGKFTHEEAKDLSDVMNAGALPVNVSFVEETAVGPLLGKTSIQQSLMAGAIGLGLVVLFMLGYYRFLGLVAVLALLAVYTPITYAIFLLVGVTFTLAGIAGFILSIGMAVDANILIFERTKEEIKKGRSLHKAIDVGFERAFPSIFDSNMTTLITCLLLWVLGTGPVKGFALTLAIGVAVSMFSAITATRTFLYLMTGSGGKLDDPGRFGLQKSEIAVSSPS